MLGPLPEGARIHIGKVLDALLVLVAWARDPISRPLVTLRVQVWLRELRRMVVQVRSDSQNIELRADSDIKREQASCTCHFCSAQTAIPQAG